MLGVVDEPIGWKIWYGATPSQWTIWSVMEGFILDHVGASSGAGCDLFESDTLYPDFEAALARITRVDAQQIDLARAAISPMWRFPPPGYHPDA